MNILRKNSTRTALTEVLRPPTLPFRTLVSESYTSLVLRPGRSLLTSAGTLLGVWVVVVVIGVAGSAQNQVDERFQRATATSLVVTQETDPATVRGVHLRPDTDGRLRALKGVIAAGHEWQVMNPPPQVSTNPPGDDEVGSSVSVSVRAASAGLLELGRMTVEGAWLGEPFQQSGARVAVVGAGAARDLNLATLSSRPVVFLNGVSYSIIGIMQHAPNHPELQNSVMIPTGTARREFLAPNLRDTIHAYVTVRTGAANVVGAQVAGVIDPRSPQRFSVAVPLQSSDLQSSINRDLRGLFLVLSGVCLLAGMIGIANTSLISVMERTAEFGLRRALGARPIHIALQVVTEAALLGGFGGLWGAALGTLIVVSVSYGHGWTAILAPVVPILGPSMGVLIGIVAGIQPALRASRIEPLEALRLAG